VIDLVVKGANNSVVVSKNKQKIINLCFIYAIAAVLLFSTHKVPFVHTKQITNVLAETVPVAKVAVVLKFVPNVKTRLVVPLVVITKATSCAIPPPLALKVQAPVGVTVIIAVVIGTVMVPVLAEVAEDEPNKFTAVNGVSEFIIQ
jgi:hypothetical protein